MSIKKVEEEMAQIRCRLNGVYEARPTGRKVKTYRRVGLWTGDEGFSPSSTGFIDIPVEEEEREVVEVIPPAQGEERTRLQRRLEELEKLRLRLLDGKTEQFAQKMASQWLREGKITIPFIDEALVFPLSPKGIRQAKEELKLLGASRGMLLALKES